MYIQIILLLYRKKQAYHDNNFDWKFIDRDDKNTLSYWLWLLIYISVLIFFFFLLETLHYGIMNWRLNLTVTWILQCWRTGVFTCFVSDDMTHFRPGCTSGTVNAGLSLDPQGHPIFQRQRKTLSRKCY